ncbi:hypothetical protein R1sor_013513 [Riccia sorocarpa]|uniref:Exocyst complex component SEC5 n=1 Tax=Riccia sorocarpa TaxID=122646 RepID=A0ABD3HAM8_9MARC
MSSDEDDDEELLQRALAEQAQRDPNYKRPPQYPPPAVASSAAPRRTPPQTPPPLPPSGAPSRRVPPPQKPPPPAPPKVAGQPIPAPKRPAPPPPRPMEDDEESEVELLSISSEDEDAPPPSRRPPVAKAKVAHGDDSDLEWSEDDEEPENWKHVDQAELARRVREMRETRAAPTATSTARIRRSTSLIEPPRGEDLLDPLGLGPINLKALALQREAEDSPALGRRKASDDPTSQEETPVIRDAAAREKVMYHSENFDPKFFLARIHQNTSAAELEAGEAALKANLQSRREQLKRLVKDHFDCFISCKNTIDDIHSKLQQIEADPEGAGTVHLSDAIQSVDAVAKRAFGPLLERQAQAERIRSVQGMLQRFRTLFNLPSIIRSNISKGEYDLAIREYKKAKSLVQYTHVSILNRVLEEVEKIVQEFKDTLYKTMENPNVEIPQLENTFRLLLELEPDSDPVWHYLTIQDRRIRGLLEGCSIEHEARMEALRGRVQEKVQSDARWKQLQRESNKSSDVDFNLLLGDTDKEGGESQLNESTGEESDALLGRLIRRLTAVIVQHVPNFWRLALSIFSGKFAKVAQAGSVNGRQSVGSNHDAASYPYEEQPESKYTTHSVDEVVTMVHCIIALYETKVQNAFIALTEANVLRPYMKEALMEISKACAALEDRDCAPGSAVQALLVLRTEVTRVFVLRVCTLMRGATAALVQEEDWIPVPTVKRGGSPYAISAVPLRFREMLVLTLEHMAEMIEKLTSKTTELHEDLSLQVRQMQETVRNTFVDCFHDFAECLDRLTEDISLNSHSEDETGVDGGALSPREETFTGLIAGTEVTNYHQRLLMVLSNTAYTKGSLLPDLNKKYQRVWNYGSQHPASKGRASDENDTSSVDEASQALKTLEEKILDHYNTAKASVVGEAAAAYLLDDATLWSQTPPIKGIRDNAVELLQPLVAVHAEVFAGAKPFLEKVISVLVEGLMLALRDVFVDNKSKVLRILDVNGYSQLMLELDFVDAVLERYFVPTARDFATSLRDFLLERVCESIEEIHQAELASGGRRSRNEEMLDVGPSMSREEIQAYANQVSAEHLPMELRRTRVNVTCFTESLPEYSPGARRLPLHSIVGRHPLAPGGSLIARHLRKSSGSSLGGESDPGRLSVGLPPLSPHPGYASSDAGSETSKDRFSRLQSESRLNSESRRTTRRSATTNYG